MPSHSFGLDLVDDRSWSELDVDPRRIDPGIRLVASLIDVGDAEQLFLRTGMRLGANGRIANPRLPLFVEIRPDRRMQTLEALSEARIESQGFLLSFAKAYFKELERNARLRIIPARLAWGRDLDMRRAIARLLRHEGVKRVALPNPLHPCLEASLADMEMPPDRRFGAGKATGKGVIVGVIDDGCALAHPHFLQPGTLNSRILYLWDPAGAAGASPYWSHPGNFHGRELTRAAIDDVLRDFSAGGRVEQDKVYEALGYEIDLSAHGTHVLDIAAGNGTSLMGHPGVAPEADIIFVQLPRDLVEQGSVALEDSIQDGVEYVFDRAAALGKQAVVNISFGGYCGPHDGSSNLASGMDVLLGAMPGRAAVVSAGNGFEADCHAQGTVPVGGHSQDLVWLLRPEDPTSNQLEIWYDGNAKLELLLKPPGRPAALPAVGLGQWKIITRTADNGVLGWIQHENNGAPRGGSNVIRINLASTVGEDGAAVQAIAQGNTAQGGVAAPPPLSAPAESGAWTLRLLNAGPAPVDFHAWIERDDMRRRHGRRRQQSRFHEANANPWSTVADLGTGELVICVGAHNTATSQMCRYSACGPTRNGLAKPDLTAPAEETAAGGGVLCASARRARPARIAGTSAAAPHVAGLVALIMEMTDGNRLSAAQIRRRLTDGSAAGAVRPPPPERNIRHNVHQEVDERRNGKRQADDFAKVTGAGKVNAPDSMR